MIPQIKKILYATDLSQNSVFAFRYAINSAITHDADMIILHVIDHMLGANPAMVDLYIGEDQRKMIFDSQKEGAIDRIKKRLDNFCDQAQKNNPDVLNKVVSIEICEGSPPEVILRKADELYCDAIVMGTNGKGIISHTLFGNTAQKVLRRARHPVLIVPLPKAEMDIAYQ